jgi:hypothetical protein
MVPPLIGHDGDALFGYIHTTFIGVTSNFDTVGDFPFELEQRMMGFPL